MQSRAAWRSLGAMAIAAMTVLTVSTAEAQLGGLYFSGRLVPALGDIDNLESRTTPGGPTAPDTALVDDAVEFVAGASLAAGYDWRDRGWPIRTEVEYRYRYHFDWETFSAANDVFYDASTRYSHALQVNLAYVFGLVQGFDGYVLGGAGWRFSRTEGQEWARSTNTVVDGNVSTDNTNFIWTVGAGVMWHFAEDWSAELEYRYVDLGTLDFETGTGDRLSGDAYSHDLIVGLVYRL